MAARWGIALLLGLGFAARLHAAPGDLYRCVGADGQVSFQDRRCPAGSATRFKGRTDGGERELRALRQWLSQWRTMPRPGAGAAVAAPVRGAGTLSAGAEARLARCSERFLACADAVPARMDACVSRIARCGAGAAACCPAPCIERYQGLRRGGAPLASAVQQALLDASAQSCAE